MKNLPEFFRRKVLRIQSSEVGSRLARGTLWSLGGAVISRGLQLASSILVARMLGKENFGVLGMVQSTIGMLGIFAGFGLGTTATKYIAEYRDKDPERAGRILGLSAVTALISGLVLACVLFALAPYLARTALNAPHLSGYLRIGCLVLLLSATTGAQNGALAGFEAFRAIACRSAIAGAITLPLMILGAYFAGVRGAIWALVGSLLANAVLNHLALRKERARYRIPGINRTCRRECGVLLSFSLPALLAGALVGPVNWACAALLVNQPDGYGEMGVFNAANQWFTALMFLPSIIGHVALPILAERLASDQVGHSARILKVSMLSNLAIMLPLLIVGSLASRLIMGSYGPGFADSWPTLLVVLWTAALLSVQTPVGQIIAASGKMWLGAAMNLGWGLVFFCATYYLIDLGALGLALGRAIAYAVHTCWVIAFAHYWLSRRSVRPKEREIGEAGSMQESDLEYVRPEVMNGTR